MHCRLIDVYTDFGGDWLRCKQYRRREMNEIAPYISPARLFEPHTRDLGSMSDSIKLHNSFRWDSHLINLRWTDVSDFGRNPFEIFSVMPVAE